MDLMLLVTITDKLLQKLHMLVYMDIIHFNVKQNNQVVKKRFTLLLK